MAAAEKISITLTPEMNRMIEKHVQAGEYASASELVRDALRLWNKREEEHQEQLAAMRTHIERALADPRPSVPAVDAFERLRAHHESRKAKPAS